LVRGPPPAVLEYLSCFSEAATVERKIAIAAAPETVWQFLIDPDKALAWWGLNAAFDPRPGGPYRIEIIPGHIASGEFVEIDAPRRPVQI